MLDPVDAALEQVLDAGRLPGEGGHQGRLVLSTVAEPLVSLVDECGRRLRPDGLHSPHPKRRAFQSSAWAACSKRGGCAVWGL